MSYAYLVITSTPIGTVDDAVLLKIQAEAVRKNAAAKVTGVLLYGAGKFLQILEGPEEALQRLSAHNAVDSRHTDFQVLHSGTCAQRAFQSWSMGVLTTYRTTIDNIENVETILKTLSSSTHECHAQFLRDICEAFALDVQQISVSC